MNNFADTWNAPSVSFTYHMPKVIQEKPMPVVNVKKRWEVVVQWHNMCQISSEKFPKDFADVLNGKVEDYGVPSGVMVRSIGGGMYTRNDNEEGYLAFIDWANKIVPPLETFNRFSQDANKRIVFEDANTEFWWGIWQLCIGLDPMDMIQAFKNVAAFVMDKYQEDADGFLKRAEEIFALAVATGIKTLEKAHSDRAHMAEQRATES